MTYSAIWQLLLFKIYGEIGRLLHPCTVTKELLKKQLPESITVEEVFDKIRLKQKEIARRLNITILPSDREPGFIGQAALFEVLRNMEQDFTFYMDNVFDKQRTMWMDGFGLLHTLGSLFQIRRYFDCPPIDLVRYLLEPLNPNSITILFDKNWLHRVMTNVHALQPFMPYNKDSYEVLKHLVKIQDVRGLNVSRISDWTGKTRRESSKLFNVMVSCGLIHYSCVVFKNTGIVRTVSKRTAPSKTLTEQDNLCTSLKDGRDYFLNFEFKRRESVDEKFHDFAGQVCNIGHFDVEEKVWKIPKTIPEVTSITDLYSLFHNSELTIPKSESIMTERDLFYIALLQSMPMEIYPMKQEESIHRIAKGCDIPRKEVKQGMRNIHRKNMIRHQYSFIISHCRQFLYVVFDDSPEKSIQLLGKILPSVPVIYVSVSADLGYGLLAITFPEYLACDVRQVIHLALNETDANAELFVVKSFKRGDAANLLALIPDDVSSSSK